MGPYSLSKRVPLDGVLYPRYSSVEELVSRGGAAATPISGGSGAAHLVQAPAAAAPIAQQPSGKRTRAQQQQQQQQQQDAEAALKAAQASAPATSSAALLAAAKAAEAAGADKEQVEALERKAAKRAKREQRRPANAIADAHPPQQQQQHASGAAAHANGVDNDEDDSDEEMEPAAPQQQQPQAKGAAKKGNAEEAARIRAALGYVADAAKPAAAPAKTRAAAAAAAAAAVAPAAQPAPTQQPQRQQPQGAGGFGFGFNLPEPTNEVEAETQAKIARIMAIDSTKDGFVPRRVWVCGLPHEYSEEQVREYWQYCGPVEALDLLTFKDSGRFNGAAFVTFRTQEAYETALAANGEELEGRKLRVEKCKVAVPKRGAAAQRAAAAASPVAAPPAQPAAAPAAAPAQPPTQQQQQQPAAEQGVAADGSYNVAYVGNVAFEASEADLHKLFTPLGAQQVRLHVDAKSGRHKGFAHVHFADAASLAKALALDGTALHGRNLKVLQGAPPKKKPAA